MNTDENNSNVEAEQLYIDDVYKEISPPFDPRQINIETRTMVISNIVERLKYNEIILNPDYQRRADLWDVRKQSRLIESLLIRIPLPMFYFDMPDDDSIIVVDGVQRLCAIRNFIALENDDPRKLKLTDMEYLKDLNGKTFEEIPPQLRRRINEQTIQSYVIKQGTPDTVRNSIFERINTGGLVLTSAEIKNSVYRGKAADFVKKLAESPEFKKSTNNKIKPDRMLDREFVNRFLAFYLIDLDDYKGNFEKQLVVAMEMLKNDDLDFGKIEADFKRASNTAYTLFEKDAFVKSSSNHVINKAIYESVMVQLARLSEEESNTLIEKKDHFSIMYRTLITNDEEFLKSVTSGTARLNCIKYRHNKIEEIIKEVLKS